MSDNPTQRIDEIEKAVEGSGDGWILTEHERELCVVQPWMLPYARLGAMVAEKPMWIHTAALNTSDVMLRDWLYEIAAEAERVNGGE